MKIFALISSLLLLVAVSATAASPDTKKTQTVPRAINWAIGALMTFELDPKAPPGSIGIRTITDGSGQLTHLGAAVVHTEHTPWPDAQGTVTNGKVTITAANGDQIWATYQGTTEMPDSAHYIGHAILVINGGTGRFAAATGTLDASAFVTVTSPPGLDAVYPTVWVLEGTISY